MVLPLTALALVALALGAGALWVGRRLPTRRARLALAGATLLAAPMAWTATLTLGARLVEATAPVAPATFAAYVAAAIVLLAVLQLLAVLVPEPRVWPLAAIVPLGAAIIASVQPRTTLGGPLAVALAILLLAAAALLPRAAALATVDRSRAFVGIVAAVALALGGAFGAFLGAAAVEEGGLALAPATRAWRVEAEPSFEERYQVVVPFPVSDEGLAREVATAWRRDARVVEGDGTATIGPDGATILVEGQGPLVVEASYTFHAPDATRGDLTSYRLAERAVTLDAGEGAPPNATASVSWRAQALGGGATCATREATVVVADGERAELSGEAHVWPGVVCGRAGA